MAAQIAYYTAQVGKDVFEARPFVDLVQRISLEDSLEAVTLAAEEQKTFFGETDLEEAKVEAFLRGLYEAVAKGEHLKPGTSPRPATPF